LTNQAPSVRPLLHRSAELGYRVMMGLLLGVVWLATGCTFAGKPKTPVPATPWPKPSGTLSPELAALFADETPRNLMDRLRGVDPRRRETDVKVRAAMKTMKDVLSRYLKQKKAPGANSPTTKQSANLETVVWDLRSSLDNADRSYQWSIQMLEMPRCPPSALPLQSAYRSLLEYKRNRVQELRDATTFIEDLDQRTPEDIKALSTDMLDRQKSAAIQYAPLIQRVNKEMKDIQTKYPKVRTFKVLP
jgi:hypothetical protein